MLNSICSCSTHEGQILKMELYKSMNYSQWMPSIALLNVINSPSVVDAAS